MKIVQFGDGKYGVMIFHLFSNNEFLVTDLGYIKTYRHPFYVTQKDIEEYCKFDTIDAARNAMNIYLAKEKQKKISRSYKVIE